MSFKFFEKLTQNFIELLNDKDDYNVIIEIENMKSFTAHSSILKYRSNYFRLELENITPNENNIKIINKPNISHEIFDIILKYIYGGIVNLENLETRFIFDLMMLADEFGFEELTEKLETLLIETKSSWLKVNFSLVYRSILSGNDFKDLKKFCHDIIANSPPLVFDAKDFTSLQESALVPLLERDDLQLEEIKIWEYLIEWGIAQNSNLPEELEKWTNENFLTLKSTLKQCLPLIRYFHIPSTYVWNKVKPYKKLLDKQLWDDLKQHLLAPSQPTRSIIILPPRSVVLTSAIITREHAAEISSWIDRSLKSYETSYKFELILRGSINGFAPQTFWKICHGYSKTVVVVKVKGTDEILGGYNPLTWDSSKSNDSWESTSYSFIFSLKNGNIQNSILSKVKNYGQVIKNVGKDNQKKYGPHFGDDFYMYSSSSDFTLDNECCVSGCNGYEKPIRTSTDKFSIDEYEVFTVIKP
ncbi:hypothetical protein Glove_352g55 [Diversispora epigaea]|uniref:BTB domain-containing protein n=1 Tax=Diversispora epigaea TaxID=1348612 RepID=A0A397HC12_9GLOM|nr:hypothetical protein Glove_352g55 [Diversispora epigaea]